MREWDFHTGLVLDTVSQSAPQVISPSGRYVGWPDRLPWGLPGAPCAQIWETKTGRARATIVSLRDAAWLTVAPSGHYRGSPGIERQLTYVVQTDEGQQTLAPEEFSQKYGWKKDPEQVKLVDEPDAGGRPSSP